LLQVRFNALVLLVKVCQIRHQILDNVHVGERVDLGGLAGVAVDSAKACQGVGTFNVHGARTANTFTARPTEGQGRIHLVFDLDESVQHHWATGIQVNLVFLERWLFCRLIWVPAVDLKGLVQRLLLGRGVVGRRGIGHVV